MILQAYVGMEIFGSPNLKRKIDSVFEANNEMFVSRFEEIKNFILTHNKEDLVNYDEVTIDQVFEAFKSIIFKSVSKNAVETAFSSTKEHDIEKIIGSLITEESIFTAINGRTMINAFCKVIMEIPTHGMLILTIKHFTCEMLKKQFLGEESPEDIFISNELA